MKPRSISELGGPAQAQPVAADKRAKHLDGTRGTFCTARTDQHAVERSCKSAIAVRLPRARAREWRFLARRDGRKRYPSTSIRADSRNYSRRCNHAATDQQVSRFEIRARERVIAFAKQSARERKRIRRIYFSRRQGAGCLASAHRWLTRHAAPGSDELSDFTLAPPRRQRQLERQAGRGDSPAAGTSEAARSVPEA